MLEELFKNFEKEYQNIFSSFYPSLEGTGFQERNLSVNFAKAYEKTFQNDNVFSWFELQFPNDKNKLINHFDCLIANISKKEIYFVEAKRYNSAKRQKERAKEDITRIEKFVENHFSVDPRFHEYRDFQLYGIILADVWQESHSKRRLYKEFINQEIFKDMMSNDRYILYKTIRFNYDNDSGVRINALKDSNQEYDLLTFLWKL